MKLNLEQLESKENPLSITLDFRFDYLGFFTPAKQRILQNIADEFASRFETIPSAINREFIGYTHFSSSVDFDGLPEDKMMIFVGNETNLNNLASAYSNVYSSDAFLNRVWGGSIAFNPNTNWSYSGRPSSNQWDLSSIFKHELLHIFGVYNHSNNFNDLMYAYIDSGKIKDITFNDAMTLRGAGLELKSIPTNFEAIQAPFPGFGGTFQTSVGDFNGDKVKDLVCGAGQGGGPHIKIIDGANGKENASFYAFEEQFRGGVNITVGDYTKDGKPDLIIGAGKGGGPRLQIYDNGKTLIYDEYAFPANQTTGVNVNWVDDTLLVNDGINFKIIK